MKKTIFLVMSKRLWGILGIVFLPLLFLKVNAQENLLLYTTKVSIKVENKALREILNEVEKKNNLTFSYKAGLINENDLKTIDVVDFPLYNLLDSLLSDDSLEYYPLGRQIVIYTPTSAVKTKKIVVRDTLEQIVLRKDTVQVKIYKTDTVYRTRVNTIYDTVFVKEPFPVFDTVYMDKPKLEWSLSYTYNYFSAANSFNEEFIPTIKDAKGRSLRGVFRDSENDYGSMNRLLALIQINLNQSLFLKTGIGITTKRWKANYNYKVSYVDSTSITGYIGEPEPIYEITGYVYIKPLDLLVATDSAIVDYDYSDLSPEYESKESAYIYSGTNSVTYFTLPVLVGFERQLSEDYSLFIESGFLIDFMLSSKGQSLNSSPYIQLEPLASLPMSPVNAFWTLDLGVQRKLSSDLSVFVKTNYGTQLQSTFSSPYFIHQQQRSFGFSLGVEF